MSSYDHAVRRDRMETLLVSQDIYFNKIMFINDQNLTCYYVMLYYVCIQKHKCYKIE